MALPTYLTANIVDGGVANIADLNTPLNEILTLLTGALDALNLRDGGVGTDNIEDLAVIAAKIANLQTPSRAFADASITHGKFNFFSVTQLVAGNNSVIVTHGRNTLLPMVGIGLQAAAAPAIGDFTWWTVVDANNIEIFNADANALTFEVFVL